MSLGDWEEETLVHTVDGLALENTDVREVMERGSLRGALFFFEALNLLSPYFLHEGGEMVKENPWALSQP